MKYFTLVIGLIVLLSCQKENDRIVQGQAIIEENNKPIADMVLIFDVATGSGFFGGVDRRKYETVTDKEGRFEILVDEIDKDNYLWVNMASTHNGCPSSGEVDTTNILYSLDGNKRYIQRNKKMILWYHLRGRISFQVTKATFKKNNIDTVIVQSNIGIDTLAIDPHNNTIGGFRNVESSTFSDFTFLAIKNGIIQKSYSKNLFVRHQCLTAETYNITF